MRGDLYCLLLSIFLITSSKMISWTNEGIVLPSQTLRRRSTTLQLVRKLYTIFRCSPRRQVISWLFPDTHGDLLDWTTKIINSVRLAVETLKVMIYPGSWKGTRVKLHLDVEEGLKLYAGDDKVPVGNSLICFCSRKR